MTERERILARIRQSLQHEARMPGTAHGAANTSATLQQSARVRSWLPAVGSGLDAHLELFQRKLAELKGEFHLLESSRALGERLRELARTEGWQRVGAHRGRLVEEAVAALELPVCFTDEPYEVKQLEACQAGITLCDALVAQTGSVMVTGRSAGGRALSVLPAHHVVLATRQQLIGDLPEAFELLKRKYSPDYPSFISLITGPSRTGDIERILVLGAHGPKKLTVFCI